MKYKFWKFNLRRKKTKDNNVKDYDDNYSLLNSEELKIIDDTNELVIKQSQEPIYSDVNHLKKL